MKIEGNKAAINWQVVLGVLGVIPPLGIIMILNHWYKSGRYSTLSVLCLVLGVIYSLFIFVQLYKLL